MLLTKLSASGYCATNVFDTAQLERIYSLNTGFTPTSTRTGDDGTALREILLVDDDLKQELDAYFIPRLQAVDPTVNTIAAVELWRDYPGYSNGLHRDDPEYVRNVMIVYLDNASPATGTEYQEADETYCVPYAENTAIVLLGSDQILHGMSNCVAADCVRRTLYLTW